MSIHQLADPPETGTKWDRLSGWQAQHKWTEGLVVALAAMVAAAGAFQLFRPGYSPDEEFTIFAVRGITAHGLPLLPSGLLYDRGLLYSYLSWAAGAIGGTELPAFRALSLACGVVTLAIGFVLVRRVASVAAAAAACVLVATSLPFWAVITTGRFYAPFLFTCIAALLFVARARRPPGLVFGHSTGLQLNDPAWAAVFIVAFASRLLHELAFTLVAIPAAAVVLSFTAGDVTRTSRRYWVMIALALLAGLFAAQALVMGLHFLMPPTEGGGTMIRRFFLWQVLNLFERPRGAPLGIVAAAMVVGILAAPRQARKIGLAAAAVAIAIVVGALAFGPSGAVSASRVIRDGLAYPLDMFWHLATAYPVMVWTGLALMMARLCEAGGDWPLRERAAHLAWVAWVLWFGVIESGITINYVLLPATCLLAAIGMDLVALGEHTRAIWPGRRAQVTRSALVGVALLVMADQWRGEGPLSQRLAAARPTIDVPGILSIRAALRPEDRVACTDELACLLLVGRVDAWLALDDYVRERFLVERGAARVGVYAGAPALFSVAELLQPDSAGHSPPRAIVVDVFKEYPVGNSRTWLPRAVAAEGLGIHTLVETPQVRVVEVRRQETGDRR